MKNTFLTTIIFFSYLLLWLVIFLAGCKSAHPLIKQQLIDMEINRSNAIAAHDTITLDHMYSEDFRGVTAIGFTVDKKTLMRVFKLDNPSLIFSNTDQTVRILNNKTALLTGKLTARTKDNKIVQQSLYLHVLQKKMGGGRLCKGKELLYR